jgi:hypothetical protein
LFLQKYANIVFIISLYLKFNLRIKNSYINKS